MSKQEEGYRGSEKAELIHRASAMRVGDIFTGDMNWEEVARQADSCDELIDMTTGKAVYPDVQKILRR